MHIGQSREWRVGVAGDGDKPCTLTLDQGHDAHEFFGRARIGQGNQHIIAGDHAEIAVAGLCGMKKECGGAGGCEGCSDLARDMPGFADSADHHAAAAGEHQRACVDERRPDPQGERLYRVGFSAQNFDRAQNQPLGTGYNGLRRL